jgi:ribonuclease VapC
LPNVAERLKMSSCVLDASALLAYLQDEPGADEVAEFLSSGVCMSAVNWAEVLSKVSDAGHDPAEFVRSLEAEGLVGGIIEVVPLSVGYALTIGQLRAATRSIGLSLGDRACLALALAMKLPVVTVDRAWSALVLDVPVHQVRPASR